MKVWIVMERQNTNYPETDEDIVRSVHKSKDDADNECMRLYHLEGDPIGNFINFDVNEHEVV